MNIDTVTFTKLLTLTETLAHLLGIALTGKGENAREAGNAVFSAYPGELPLYDQDIVRFVFDHKDLIGGLNIDKETLNLLVPEYFAGVAKRAKEFKE